MTRPAFTQLAPVLRVADLGRALAYYRDALGFEVEFVHAAFYAGLHRDGCRLHLKRAAPTPRDQRAFEAEQHVDVCVGTGDADALQARLLANGADIALPLREMPYGREFHVRDPDGHVLGFVQPREGA